MNSETVDNERQPPKQPRAETSNAPKDSTSKWPAGKRKDNKKNRKKKAPQSACPMKILSGILEKTSFKVPNLSESVEEKFYKDIDYKLHIDFLLSDIIYKPTVHEIADGDTPISVLPSDVVGKVNLSPSAVTDLNDIYHTFPSRWGKKRKNKKGNRSKQNNKVNNSPNTNNHHNHKESAGGKTTFA